MRSAPEWYGNPVLEVMLLDHDEPTNYEEANMSKPLRINGSSIGRRMVMVVLLSTKLELSQKVFDKFKVLTMMRFSHSY